jgi:type I restriction enzyme S subunit
MSFPHYKSYKDSGVEWLGTVPTHWEVKSIKWLSPVLRGASPRPIDDPKYFDSDGEYAWVRISDVSASDGALRETTQRLSALGSGSSVKLEPGALFVSIAGTVGKPCVTAIKACIHDGFVYFPRLNIDQRLLFRIFEAGVCYGGLGKWGTQLNLNTDTIGSIRVAVPPRDELRKLLSFLDSETAKIDKLLAEQKRLIELLEEKRQGVISHAVTKGLNPNAPMKDSGVEWLGTVPAHWRVTRLKFIADVQGGIAKGKDYSDHETIEVPYLRVANVQDGFLDLETITTIEIPANELHRYLLQVGDVLMNEGGDFDKLGRGHIWNAEIDPCIHQNHVFAVRPKTVSSQWLNEITGSNYAQFYFMTRSKQSTNLASISSTNIMDLPVVLPPVAEQEVILSTVGEQRSRFNALAAEAQAAITLLQERRTALISAAVTGKIDVRGLVATRSETEVAA